MDKYYNVGKLLSEAGKHYGEGIIKKYSIKLINELDKKYNVTLLKRIRQFYYLIEKGATLWHQLNWSHYKILIPLQNVDKINYYINIAVKMNYSVRELEERIKSKEYERLPNDTKNKLINNNELNIKELIPESIIIKRNSNVKEDISEKALHKLIVENIKDFMNQLGSGYSYISDEYKIKIGNTYNYIDLLLFQENMK